MRIDAGFYINNRRELMDRMPDGTAVFLFSGEAAAMCADTDYRFLPDRNFYYMTGLSYENGRLVMVKKDGDITVRLYAPVRDSMKERWNGRMQSFAELSEISGIEEDDIRSSDDYDDDLLELLRDDGIMPASDSASIFHEAKVLPERVRAVRGDDKILDIREDLISMRMVKKDVEIEAIREAGRITEAALADMRTHIRPGVTESELYAALEYSMTVRGSLIPAFGTITAIGSNSFYLHHADPDGTEGVVAREGDMIQIDVGARVAGYCADISRVYFVGGEGCGIRSGEDRDHRFRLLGLIRKLRSEALSMIAPGVTIPMLNSRMREITLAWLVENGIADEEVNARDYYWHNIGHHLGLDVHDCSLGKDVPFEPGNCLAIEPGVYIPEWNVGFRIEDDVLVTENGCELLTGGEISEEDIVVL